MRINEVMANLLLKEPFYGYAAAAVTFVESKEVHTTSMISLHDIKFIYNKSWFEGLKEEHAIGVIIHELLHLILLHPVRGSGKDCNLWDIACDMAVNEYLDRKLLLNSAITVEKIEDEIREKLLKQKSAEYYYEILCQNEEKLSFVGIEDEINVVLNSGQELKANKSIEGNSSEVNKNAFIYTISEILQQSKSECEIPSDINEFIDELYEPYEINWRNVLKRFLTGKGKILKRKTYKKESKRFENMPGNKSTMGTKALLALDESGSISDEQITRFYYELLNIKKITGVSLSVTRFDTQCTQPVPIDNYLRNKERLKNGGTDFRPVFELADKIGMRLIIIFTDGDGIAPEQVNQKVLWVLTKGGKEPANYGHYILYR